MSKDQGRERAEPAVVFTAVNTAPIADVPMPPPRPGEIQVRTHRSSISVGTEGWILRDLFTWSPTPYPCVPGYQRVGAVTAVGEGVTGWRVGERAMAVGGDWEGAIASFWGGHVAAANVPERMAFHLPERVSESAAACLVVAQVGYNAASRPALAEGDWVVVFGDGLIGQFGAQAARARGAKVILAGHREERLKLAAAHSADATLDTRAPAFEAEVLAHTGGRKVTAVIDTVQTEAAQLQYLPLLEPAAGQIVYSGFAPGKAWADMGLLQQRELTAHFVAGWNRPRMEATLRLLAEGRMKVEPLVTHRAPFEEAPRLYDMILRKPEPFLDIELDWTHA